jgi:hypothetical protein
MLTRNLNLYFVFQFQNRTARRVIWILLDFDVYTDDTKEIQILIQRPNRRSNYPGRAAARAVRGPRGPRTGT